MARIASVVGARSSGFFSQASCVRCRAWSTEQDASIEHDASKGVMARSQRIALGFGVGDHVAADADPGEVFRKIGEAIEKRRRAVAKHDEEVGVTSRMGVSARQ